jgi:peptidoglycan/xylan/chitin deacetylase (PgdA/CDA1 family)
MIAISAGLGLGALLLARSTFLPAPGLHDWLVPGAIWRRPPLVHLTFDDGPDPDRTPRVLDALAEVHVRATFFLVGSKVARAPELARRIRAEGHQVGNHGWDHSSLTLCSRRTIREQLVRCNDVIASALGSPPVYARPPYGYRDYRFYQEAQQLGTTPMLWSLDSGDWLGLSPTRLVRRVLRARPGEIILFHDGNHRAGGLLGALEQILLHHRPRLPMMPQLVATT